jgi:hypothetical protein
MWFIQNEACTLNDPMIHVVIHKMLDILKNCDDPMTLFMMTYFTIINHHINDNFKYMTHSLW